MAPPSALVPPAAIVQNCYVVPDLEAACARFHAAYGIGPFVGGVEFLLEDHRYRGVAAPPVRLRGVFVQAGDLNLELVQVLSSGPDAFHELFPVPGTGGFHHAAMFAEDYAGTRDRLAAAGYPVVSEFSVPALGAEICYVDTRPLNGHLLEIYPENAGIRAMYARARDAAREWDRQSLIVPWA